MTSMDTETMISYSSSVEYGDGSTDCIYPFVCLRCQVNANVVVAAACLDDKSVAALVEFDTRRGLYAERTCETDAREARCAHFRWPLRTIDLRCLLPVVLKDSGTRSISATEHPIAEEDQMCCPPLQ